MRSNRRPGAERRGFLRSATATVVVGAALLLSPAATAQSGDAAAGSTDMSWIVGEWRNERNGSVEAWEKLSDDVYVATTTAGDRVIERIILYRSGDRWFYVPDVSHNALPVHFLLTESSERVAVFENLSHDYPKRIAYSALEEGRLEAVISDVDENGAAVRPGVFRFTRVR